MRPASRFPRRGRRGVAPGRCTPSSPPALSSPSRTAPGRPAPSPGGERDSSSSRAVSRARSSPSTASIPVTPTATFDGPRFTITSGPDFHEMGCDGLTTWGVSAQAELGSVLNDDEWKEVNAGSTRRKRSRAHNGRAVTSAAMTCSFPSQTCPLTRWSARATSPLHAGTVQSGCSVLRYRLGQRPPRRPCRRTLGQPSSGEDDPERGFAELRPAPTGPVELRVARRRPPRAAHPGVTGEASRERRLLLSQLSC